LYEIAVKREEEVGKNESIEDEKEGKIGIGEG